ncbi:MAG: helix-turn-helix transcriptional regulator [Saccharospirillaceae bacterium]|nr:AraC family transcriptional regulator [Pseudomonadales bacterium]NRB79254.1 helix-turn-helix transcriptional regulator [Saccharospirillaceae bacterium]
MKTNINKLDEVLTYIENNLSDPLDVDALALIGCLSKFHFHRQFKSYFGFNLIQFVKFLRLKKSAYELVFQQI